MVNNATHKWIINTSFGSYVLLARTALDAATQASGLGLVGTIALANDSQVVRRTTPNKTRARALPLRLAA